jgi:hypothetical protein
VQVVHQLTLTPKIKLLELEDKLAVIKVLNYLFITKTEEFLKRIVMEKIHFRQEDNFNFFQEERKMKYFVKNTRVHKQPPQNGCNAKRTNEPLHDKPPAGVDKCDRCFNLPR